jgi:hypothetical protein
LTLSGQSQTFECNSSELNPEAKQALGEISAEVAWLQVGGLVFQWTEAHRNEARKLCGPIDSRMDQWKMDEILRRINPVVGINQLHFSTPDLNLQDIPHQDPVEVLKALIRLLTISSRLNHSSSLGGPILPPAQDVARSPHILTLAFERLVLIPFSIVLDVGGIILLLLRHWGDAAVYLGAGLLVAGVGQGLPHRARQSIRDLASGRMTAVRYGDFDMEAGRALSGAMMKMDLIIPGVVGFLWSRQHPAIWSCLVAILAFFVFPCVTFIVCGTWAFQMEKFAAREMNRRFAQEIARRLNADS